MFEKETQTNSSNFSKDTTGVNKKKRLVIVIIIIVLLLIGGSIGGLFLTQKTGKRIIEKGLEHQIGEKSNVKISKGEVKVKGREGSFNVGNIKKLPDNCPKDIPIYPNAKIKMVSCGPKGSENLEMSLYMDSSDSVDKILAYYREKLARRGWSESNYSAMGIGVTITYIKQERQAGISIVDNQNQGKRNLVISVGVLPK